MVQRVGDLDIEQDLDFERRETTAQHAGRALMAVLILAALLGFFGAGPLSLTTIQTPSEEMSVTYERFGRRGATTNLTLQIDSDVAANGKVDVWVASDYLGKMRVNGITPTPDQVASADDGAIYTFLVERPDAPLTVNFNFTIEAMGAESGRVGLWQGEIVDLDHFFTP